MTRAPGARPGPTCCTWRSSAPSSPSQDELPGPARPAGGPDLWPSHISWALASTPGAGNEGRRPDMLVQTLPRLLQTKGSARQGGICPLPPQWGQEQSEWRPVWVLAWRSMAARGSVSPAGKHAVVAPCSTKVSGSSGRSLAHSALGGWQPGRKPSPTIWCPDLRPRPPELQERNTFLLFMSHPVVIVVIFCYRSPKEEDRKLTDVRMSVPVSFRSKCMKFLE